MKNRSIYLLLVELQMSSETMTPLSFSFRGLISSRISLILISQLKNCSGGDWVTIKISQLGSRAKIFRHVSHEKLGPTKSVRLFIRSSFSDTFFDSLF